ncbi:hypothetical protein [Scleromatobacter humisilvae]|uniref:Uncharacterized protein n=1 Tax=Scleromatobacter humisilvae TaxID=2897159 RepID=A0A9X1YEI6_9BURK|nr:hypothetical protein [Scleromatobacter humisilvae]MCK9684132.1 hypothetical protein [Scleromatobacter humisilvae]
MTSPRPPLRLVGRDGEDDADFEPVEREPHDLHPPYLEPGAVDDGEPASEEDAPRTALSPRFVVAALVVFQLLAASSYLGKYIALTQGDDQFRFAAAMSLPASLCLYLGAILLALRPGRGRVLFIVAAAGFGLSLPAWGVGYGWSWPIAFGAILALAGAWFARAEVRPDDASAAQP